MWTTILSVAPALFGMLGKVAPSVFGRLHKATEDNKGATLATLFGGSGFLSNPDVRNFLAEILSKAAELLQVAT